MYTNWPFTAKQTHRSFTCLNFAKRRFLQRLDVSIKSATEVTGLFSRSIYQSQISKGRETLQLPNSSTDGKKKNRRALSHYLSAFQNKTQREGLRSDIGRARTLQRWVVKALGSSHITGSENTEEHNRLTWTSVDA